MRKWHLGKHSRRGPCSCSGWCPRHSPHVRWSCTSILAFYWHGKVTGPQRMPAELQPELVNIYFQACRCQRWSLRIYSCGALSEAVVVKITDSFFFKSTWRLYNGGVPVSYMNVEKQIVWRFDGIKDVTASSREEERRYQKTFSFALTSKITASSVIFCYESVP